MKDGKLKIIMSGISIMLFISLIVKLINVPGGMILSGLFLGGMIIVGILIGCFIVVGILRLLFRKSSFLVLYSISTAFCFLIFHYVLYSPKLIIVVPKGYYGKVNLVLSNVNQNILTLDSNGIGYIDRWTFDKIYTEPDVIETDGNNINNRCVGFNPSAFWGKGRSSGNRIEIQSMSFEIVPKDKIGQKQYYHTDLSLLVDSNKIRIKN